MTTDMDKNRQQHGEPGNRADNLDDKRKKGEDVNNPQNTGTKNPPEGVDRPDREGSENIEKKRSA